MLQFLDETIDNKITFIFNSFSRSRDSVFAQHIVMRTHSKPSETPTKTAVLAIDTIKTSWLPIYTVDSIFDHLTSRPY